MSYQPTVSQLIHLADNALILGHRLSEWCGHGPALEQDIALSNIALDYVGAARNWYQLAANQINSLQDKAAFPLNAQGEATEDTLAYLRDAFDFKNFLLLELPNGDWAVTTLRLLLSASYQQLLLQQLSTNEHADVAAIAAKSLKEVTYHVRWSEDWVKRLGDGTDESHQRLQAAYHELWPYIGEFWENKLALPIDIASMQAQWLAKINQVFEASHLPQGVLPTWHQTGGNEGIHTEHLGYILAEMQFLQRAYPNAEW
jgi:ring-1,2-phenylacetyl-CoA epoxidase subunit PaaC